MFNDLVKSLFDWLKELLNLEMFDIMEIDMMRWCFEWGWVFVLYEIKLFNYGIYIVWNII